MHVEHDGRYTVVASNGGGSTNPTRYAALLRHPFVELQDGAITRHHRADEERGDDKARWWRRAVDALPSFADYRRDTTREIPGFVLTPVATTRDGWHELTASVAGLDLRPLRR